MSLRPSKRSTNPSSSSSTTSSQPTNNDSDTSTATNDAIATVHQTFSVVARGVEWTCQACQRLNPPASTNGPPCGWCKHINAIPLPSSLSSSSTTATTTTSASTASPDSPRTLTKKESTSSTVSGDGAGSNNKDGKAQPKVVSRARTSARAAVNNNNTDNDIEYERYERRYQIIRAILIFVVFLLLHYLWQTYVLDKYFGKPKVDDAALRAQVANGICPPGAECEYDVSQLEKLTFD